MVRAMMGKKKAEYIQDGLLLWLDGRDAPVNNAWVDRVNKTACGITGPIEYLQDQKCYSTINNNDSDGIRQFITLPNELLLNTQVFTVQVVGKDYTNNRNGAYIGIHNNQNADTQFGIWPIVGYIEYYTYNNGNVHATRFPVQLNTIMSLSGSRNGGATCRSFANGLFSNVNASSSGGRAGNYLFRDSAGWNLRAAIYCARIYNRQLSDKEVLYNYEIDKKLFGAI